MLDYLILAADAKEAHRLQDELWAPARNITTVKAIHRGALMAAGSADVYYTDGALDALVRSAGGDGPTVSGPDIYAQADRPWRAWRRARPYLGKVRPLEAWVHLHEASIEELEDRRMGFVTMSAQRIISREQVAHARSGLEPVNHARMEVAAAVRNSARDRLVRIASSRVVVTDTAAPDGSVHVLASWTARPAAARCVPAWLVNGLDHVSSVPVQ